MTIIIEGGPGTGKSVIAVNLLAELTQRGQFVQYVSKNSAPRTVYQKKLKGTVKKSSVDNMFKGSGISINEVGCIHTSQGLEFDYVGVIIGDDLKYVNGKIVTDLQSVQLPTNL